MENFTFFNPTKIEFGVDKEQSIGQHLADHGIKNVLLCYGSERIKRDGLFDIVSQRLNEQGIALVECGGIVSNPQLSKVREGIELAKTHQVDAILSVGGGSVLDSVKAIAAGVCYPGDVWDLFTGKAPVESALPVFSILTLAATGSEMNPGAVVTNDETQEKFFIHSGVLFPKVSIVNPLLMQGVPRDYLVYSASDVIAHLIEVYFTATVHPHLQSRLVESLINTVVETTEALLADPADYNARAQFAWAATLALNGLTFSGTAGFSYPNHAIEHSLSALFNVPHGAGLSVVVPAWMKWYLERNRAQFERFAANIFGVDTGEQGIAALENWFNTIGTPTRLPQLKITAADLPAIVDNVQGNVRLFGIADTYPPEVVTAILKNAL
ncbi:iron-containing alcohol dehydrogenase [Dickeya chrysanthemi Ech1591]|uniref:Iron-containing alcohol dehydrogenase n=1 Tax=Dickeya chrysanthemi (strain Ech1591) TaxID=561229 RepID=C6CM46_DICC1|nr:iron-containing alcohol dehydrogenase [Dickeya chrysanthemi]ACT07432.1 iron-containing alcohol dehydrogenase [Dickeya chrysanthemi Ech1591]WJM86254.1 iron-containing alcohol dehydrogenase [Dickeya chrysanthemi]